MLSGILFYFKNRYAITVEEWLLLVGVVNNADSWTALATPPLLLLFLGSSSGMPDVGSDLIVGPSYECAVYPDIDHCSH
jgi:hypothetical protein